jgi:hypothetical protein
MVSVSGYERLAPHAQQRSKQARNVFHCASRLIRPRICPSKLPVKWLSGRLGAGIQAADLADDGVDLLAADLVDRHVARDRQHALRWRSSPGADTMTDCDHDYASRVQMALDSAIADVRDEFGLLR